MFSSYKYSPTNCCTNLSKISVLGLQSFQRRGGVDFDCPITGTYIARIAVVSAYCSAIILTR